MFNSFASSIIGFLIAALSTVGGHATITVTSDTASSTQATSTQVELDDSFIVGLANALVRLQTRFEHGRSGKDGNNANGISDEDEDSHETDDSDDAEGRLGDARKDDSVLSERRREPELRGRDQENEEEFEDRDEFEDESEDEYDDQNKEGSGTGKAGTSGSAGTSGNSSTSGSTSGSTGAQTTFAMSDVAKHNTVASCYSAINGGVYDLTSWISRHPGGQSAIKGLCGVDGTGAFTNQHGGSGKPESVLAGFKIGSLTQ